MTGSELRDTLAKLELSQSHFARLIDVTPRAVTLWLVGERSIPGPVEAYGRLLASVPLSVRQVELARLKERRTEMRDGMYGVGYASGADAGFGFIILDTGRAYGADPLGGKYDGDYIYNEKTGMAELHLKLTFPPNVKAVFGICNPYEWSVNVTAEIDPRFEKGNTRILTSFGKHIDAHYSYLRGLPEA